MKTLIVALNSKYIHMSLAPWYLKVCCGPECGEVGVLESTVNDDPAGVLSAIYRETPDVVGFSCYIWNIGRVYRLLSDLKKIMPLVVTVLGGPEVSYDSKEILDGNPDVDYIIAGEGEPCFPALLACLNGHAAAAALEDIEGLCFRKAGGTSLHAPAVVLDLDSLPSPYTEEMLGSVGGRMLYYESSRGCPFSCSYCLSSASAGVRYFGMDRVGRELSVLFYSGIRQVKFVDRTFNCSKSRAMEIFRLLSGLYEKYLLETGIKPDINFHFEAAADLFDDEMLDLLARVPSGLIQFEIGVQTVNEAALEAVNRRTNIKKLFDNVQRLRAGGNIHIHLDLIAGLPFEDFSSFGRSFDAVCRLRPHQLQLGFLKLLKGTRIREEAGLNGYVFTEYPPYELLYSRYLGYAEILELKGVEEIVDRYLNSGRFVRTLDYVAGIFRSPFEFFLGFYRFNAAGGLSRLPSSLKELYTVFQAYAAATPDVDPDAVKEFLRLDFLCSESMGTLPSGLNMPVPEDFRDTCFAFLRKKENVERCLPGLAGLTAKAVYKRVRFELFNLDLSSDRISYSRDKRTVLLFDYTERDRVTGLYRFIEPEGFLI